MWLPYRLHSSAAYSAFSMLLLLTVVNAATNTEPDSSNSILDAQEGTSDVVVNEELFPSSTTADVDSRQDLSLGSGDDRDDELFSSDYNNNNNTDQQQSNNATTTDWSTIWPYFNTGCLEWLPINHVYFQLANSFLFLSYLAPPGLYGLIYLRLMLAIGSAFFAIWGWVILCAFDTFVWNAFFFLINVVLVIHVLFSLRDPGKFDDQVEEVYRTIFQPLKVTKQQFKKVVNCTKQIRSLKRGEHFAHEKQTRVETLSLLLSGSMLVNENGRTLHVLHPMQFLDSPEWFGLGVSSDDYFQVSIRACEECRVLTWHRDKLKLILLSEPFLAAVFDHILGRDVVRKLTQMKEKIASPSSGSSPFRNNLVNNSSGTSAFIDNEKMSSSLLSNLNKISVHEHGLVVAPEQLSLLDESVGKKMKNKSGTSPSNSRKLASSPTGRYDYSIVEHLDSTDI